jgi:hypothetical protein
MAVGHNMTLIMKSVLRRQSEEQEVSCGNVNPEAEDTTKWED